MSTLIAAIYFPLQLLPTTKTSGSGAVLNQLHHHQNIVISTEAVHSPIVNGAVERSPHFVFSRPCEQQEATHLRLGQPSSQVVRRKH
jgi:hypothetical protein